MSDNDKMRDIWNAHDEARNKAWREEPGTFDTLDAFKAGAAWQAAQAEQSAEDHVISIAGAYESGIGHCNDNLCNPYKVGSAESFAYDYGKEFGKARGIEQAVPVVGEVVAWLNLNKQGDVTRAMRRRDSWCKTPVYSAPTHSITAAELELLRKDAERKEELVRVLRHLKKTLEKIDNYRLCMSYNDSYFGEPEGAVKRVCSELQHCIDAAIAAEGEKE